MPKLELIPVSEAMLKSATGKRAQIAQEYVSYIEQLGEGQAGRLQPDEGESVQAIRRRLGLAAKLVGKELAIKRTGEEVYFWLAEKPTPRRRQGRSLKTTAARR